MDDALGKRLLCHRKHWKRVGRNGDSLPLRKKVEKGA